CSGVLPQIDLPPGSTLFPYTTLFRSLCRPGLPLEHRRRVSRRRRDLQKRQRREWGNRERGNGDAVEGTSARPWLTRATEERALLVLLGGDLAVRLPMPCLGTAGSAAGWTR